MIEILTYENERGEEIVFSHTSVFCPQNVEGITDVRNTIYSINSMGQDGDTFVANRIESRDITISGYIRERDPHKMRELRRQLARVLNPQLAANLMYRFGTFTREITCRALNSPVITRHAGGIYPSFAVILSCLNPFWRDATDTRNDVAAWAGSLEYPLAIPASGMVLGYRQPSLIVNVYNGGDVAAGIRIEISAIDSVVNPKILNVNTGEFVRFGVTLNEGDLLTVSTGYADKWATLEQNGVSQDALKFLDIDSTFLRLSPGDNLIRYDADSGIDNMEVSIFHRNQYLGV